METGITKPEEQVLKKQKKHTPSGIVSITIVDVKTYMIDVPPPHWGGRHWIFVKLVTDEGIEGMGECTYHTQLNHVVIELIKDWGERFLRGADPFRIEKIWSTLYEGPCVRHAGPLVTPAMSALEMACWDLEKHSRAR